MILEASTFILAPRIRLSESVTRPGAGIVVASDDTGRWTPALRTVMVDPPWPPRLVGGVLGTSHLPDNFARALLAWFLVTREDGGLISMEKSSDRGLHYLLGHLASRLDPVLGFEQVALIGINQDGTVQLLHSLFSVPVGLYSTAQWLFTCRRYLPL